MKVLQLCLRFPFPPVDGGSMAMASTAKGLKGKGVNLHIAALNTTKHFASPQVVAKAQEEYKIDTFYIDNRITPVKTLLNIFSGKSFHVSRFYNPQVAAQIAHILRTNEFDAIIFESLFMAPYLSIVRKLSKAVTVFRSHNIEYKIWERVVKETGGLLKKQYLSLQARRLKNYELALSGKFDLIAAISPNDLDFYKQIGLGQKSFYLPFGIESESLKQKEVRSKLKIGHIGSMDWIPNQEGIRWFVNEIWPKVNHNKVSCKLAGRHMPSDIRSVKNAGLKILGEVESSKSFLRDLDLLIVPLRSGSGVRIKVLESMAMGTSVLATQIGFEGINAKPNYSILKADNANDFAGLINKVAESKIDLNKISQNARALIEQEHSSAKVADLLLGRIEKYVGA